MCIRDRDYTGQLLFFFANGKVARVPLVSYQTVTRRKKLTGAYSCLLYTSTLC